MKKPFIKERYHKKNRAHKNILITGMIGIIIIVYIAIVVGKHDNQNQTVSQKQAKQIKAASYNGRDREEIQNHFAQYPNNYKEILSYAVPVITVSVATNQDMIQNLYEEYRKGKEGSLDLITFGTEGESIYHYIQYDGKDIFYFCFGREMNDIVKVFQNMYLFDIPDRYFDGFDASKLTEPFQVFVLSTDELSGYDVYEKYGGNRGDDKEEGQKTSDFKVKGFQISPFCTEKECRDFLEANEIEN